MITAAPVTVTPIAAGNIALIERTPRGQRSPVLLIGRYLGDTERGRRRFEIIDRGLHDPLTMSVEPRRVRAVVAPDLAAWCRLCDRTGGAL